MNFTQSSTFCKQVYAVPHKTNSLFAQSLSSLFGMELSTYRCIKALKKLLVTLMSRADRSNEFPLRVIFNGISRYDFEVSRANCALLSVVTFFPRPILLNVSEFLELEFKYNVKLFFHVIMQSALTTGRFSEF